MQPVLWLHVKRDHFRLVIPRQQIRVMRDAIAKGYMLVPHGEMALLPSDRVYVHILCIDNQSCSREGGGCAWCKCWTIARPEQADSFGP